MRKGRKMSLNKDNLPIGTINVHKDTQEELRKKKFANTVLDGLHDRLRELKREEIKCDIVEGKAIMGTHKGEPFCVYYLNMTNSSGEYISVLVTRWKGKDHRIKKPVDVLNGA